MLSVQFLPMLMLTSRRPALSTSITTRAQKEASRRFQAWKDSTPHPWIIFMKVFKESFGWEDSFSISPGGPALSSLVRRPIKWHRLRQLLRMLQQLLMNREDFLKTVERRKRRARDVGGWRPREAKLGPGQGGQQDISARGLANRGLGGCQPSPHWTVRRTC